VRKGPEPIMYPYLQDAVILRHDNLCWRWPGVHTPAGYAMLKVNGKLRKAATVAYELRYGPVPSGKELDHTCQNKGCWNHVHLEAVTHTENMRRVVLPNSLKTHCVNGHPFNEANTYRSKNPRNDSLWRVCRTCKRNRERVRREEIPSLVVHG